MDAFLQKRKKWFFIIAILTIGLFCLAVIAITLGTAKITIVDSFKIVSNQIPLLGRLVDISDISNNHIVIVKNIRLPRILLSIVVGMSLAISGTTFQGMFKNPMADPFIIGISSGAALGATIAIVAKLQGNFLGLNATSIFAFIGAVLATYLVYSLARIKSKVPVTTLLLSGVAIGQFLTAVMSFLMVIFSNDLNKIIFWTLGSFATRGWDQVKIIIIPLIIGWGLLYYFSKDLNLMLLGEETAHHLGIEVERIKKIILLINSFIVAIVVSVSGIIGFVGLIIPHIGRLFVGPDHRILVPVSAIAGGIFMLFADTLARTIISPIEIPVGIITALFGGPFFIYLLRKKKSSLI